MHTLTIYISKHIRKKSCRLHVENRTLQIQFTDQRLPAAGSIQSVTNICRNLSFKLGCSENSFEYFDLFNRLVYKMSENNENFLSQCPRARVQVFKEQLEQDSSSSTGLVFSGKNQITVSTVGYCKKTGQ